MRYVATSIPFRKSSLLFCALGALLGTWAAPASAGEEEGTSAVEHRSSSQAAGAASSPGAAPQTTAAPVAAEIRTGSPARVVVTSNKSSVVVSQVTAHADAQSSGYAGLHSVTWSTDAQSSVVICQAPCEFSAPPGALELTFSDGARRKLSQQVFRFQSGDNYIHVDSGSAGLRNAGMAAGIVGVATAVSGATLLILSSMFSDDDDDENNRIEKMGKYGLPLLAGGAVLGVGGFVLMAFNTTTLESGPGTRPVPPSATSNSRPVGLALGGAF